jgi:hypothetical protein
MSVPVTVIPRSSPTKPISLKAAMEQDSVRNRVKTQGKLFVTMSDYLEKVATYSHKRCTRKFLRELADDIIPIMKCPKVDRLACRNKASLICWFCENCPFLPKIPSMLALAAPAPAEPAPVAVTIPPVPAPSIFNWGQWSDGDGFFD